jgi:hypothetical protein
MKTESEYDDDRFLDYVDVMEWRTQVSAEEAEEWASNMEHYLEQIGFVEQPGSRGFLSWSPRE